MKKLYKKGKVHPSPPLISDHLAFLPATILTLTIALSAEDKEVLAYLISCSATAPTSFNGGSRKNTQTQTQTQRSSSSSSGNGGGAAAEQHPPLFYCDCFSCYMSFWVRWDSSPNRQLIHEIIDAFEDELSKKMMPKNKEKKKKSNKGCIGNGLDEVMKKQKQQQPLEEISSRDETAGECESEASDIDGGDDDDEHDCVGEPEMDLEKGSMRKLISLVGERFWGVWGQ